MSRSQTLVKATINLSLPLSENVFFLLSSEKLQKFVEMFRRPFIGSQIALGAVAARTLRQFFGRGFDPLSFLNMSC